MRSLVFGISMEKREGYSLKTVTNSNVCDSFFYAHPSENLIEHMINIRFSNLPKYVRISEDKL